VVAVWYVSVCMQSCKSYVHVMLLFLLLLMVIMKVMMVVRDGQRGAGRYL